MRCRRETGANLYHVHPDATGYVRMGENFLEEVFGCRGWRWAEVIGLRPVVDSPLAQIRPMRPLSLQLVFVDDPA